MVLPRAVDIVAGGVGGHIGEEDVIEGNVLERAAGRFDRFENVPGLPHRYRRDCWRCRARVYRAPKSALLALAPGKYAQVMVPNLRGQQPDTARILSLTIEDRLSRDRRSSVFVPGNEAEHGIVELCGVGFGCAMAAVCELDQRRLGDEPRQLAAEIRWREDVVLGADDERR
jgi:hypothetical protein